MPDYRAIVTAGGSQQIRVGTLADVAKWADEIIMDMGACTVRIERVEEETEK